MVITGEQIREARKLLGWSQLDLELRAGVNQSRISAFERGGRVRRRTISALRQAFETAGVEFTEDRASVRLRKGKMITGEQVKAARKLLGWSQADLADQLGQSDTTIALFERGKPRLSALDRSVLCKVLEAAGVEFTNGGEPSVKLKAKSRTIDAEGLNASNDE